MSSDYKPKWTFKCKGMDYNDRDYHIFGMVLKVLARLKGKKKPLVVSRWDTFFNAIIPDAVVESETYGNKSVIAFGKGLKFLVEKGYVVQETVPKKRYKLYSIADSKKDEVKKLLEQKINDYDDELKEEIDFYIEHHDVPPKKADAKYGSQAEAFNDFLKTEIATKKVENNIADDDVPF